MFSWSELTTAKGVDIFRETLELWQCAPAFVIGTDLKKTATYTTVPLENRPPAQLKFGKYAQHAAAAIDRTKAARGLVLCSMGHCWHMFNCKITDNTVELLDYDSLLTHDTYTQAQDICERELGPGLVFQKTKLAWPSKPRRLPGWSGDPAPCTALAFFRHIVLTHEDKTGKEWAAARALREDQATMFIALLHRGAFEIKQTPRANKEQNLRVAKALTKDTSIAQTIVRNLIAPPHRDSALQAIGKHLEDLPMEALLYELENPGFYVVQSPLGPISPGGCAVQAAFTDRAAGVYRGGRGLRAAQQ